MSQMFSWGAEMGGGGTMSTVSYMLCFPLLLDTPPAHGQIVMIMATSETRLSTAFIVATSSIIQSCINNNNTAKA